MGILKPKKQRRRPIRSHTVIRCPVAKNLVGACRGLCTPVDGHGPCGRLAAHAMLGRTQKAIAENNGRRPSR